MCTSREEFGTLKIHSEVEEVVAKFLNKEVAYFRLSLSLSLFLFFSFFSSCDSFNFRSLFIFFLVRLQ